jgi:iron complex outermembrane receptor protein
MSSIRTYRAPLLAGAAVAAIAAGLAPAAIAQDSAVDAAQDIIIITATKRAGGVNVQDAPLAVTAYGEQQLDARFVRDLEDLSFAMPNVQLNDVGTARGIANFTIRGVGINSSIPSVDPTVGVFVDGMYLGINSGVVLDTFDLAGVEVLRGPQGLLFGRNVTGGAVLLRTRAPSRDAFTVDGKVAVESGLNYYAMGTASGPITSDGSVAVKLAGYYNKDEGWFNNQQDNNEDFGAYEAWVVRPAISLDVTESIDTILRLEHGDTEGDGPPGQNHAVFDRDSFGFSIDFDGYANSDWDQAVWETNWRLGNGTITNILGWREYSAETGNDIDSLPISVFHARTLTDQDQISNELRYSGTFEENLDVTAGVYYFQQDTAYTEERLLFESLPFLRAAPLAAQGGRLTGGGEQDHTTWGVFSQFDMHITDTFTFNAGLRYTYEEKEAMINSLALGLALPGGSPCSIDLGRCTFNPAFSFIDAQDWSNVDGKLGFQWEPNDDVQIYGFWTSGFRSGGYNFRVSPTLQPGFNTSPGPTDPEEVDAYELGVKYDDPNGRYRINAAAFHTEIENMQRELNLPGQLGVAQFIRNTADAALQGFEVESQFTVTDSLLITGFAGYTDASYDKVLLDLSCSGLTLCAPTSGPEDLALEIPRVAPWSYGVGLIHDLPIGGFGSLTSRIDYSYRDEAPYTDNNLGVLNEAEMLDASFGFSPNDASWVFSVYGKNLLSDVTHGGDTQLPPAVFPGPIPGVPFAGPFGGPGASFSPLNKGTVIGAEAQFKF